MTTSCITRCVSSGARLILQGASKYKKSQQSFQNLRAMSELSTQEASSNLSSFHRNDPYSVVQDDLKDTFRCIKMELKSPDKTLNKIIQFCFDGESRLRPAIIILMAKALNNHVHGFESILLPKQGAVAMVAEMLHTAGVFHEISSISNEVTEVNKKTLLVGDYILSTVLLLLARIGNNEIYGGISKTLGDQVQGAFMQHAELSSEDNDQRLSHYLTTSFNKTGSLIANCCKAVAILAGADASLQELAFHYGKNVGITLQLIDDVSKCVDSYNRERSTQEQDGGSESASELMFFMLEANDGIENRRFWARQHCAEATSLLQAIQDSPEKRALQTLTNGFLNK